MPPKRSRRSGRANTLTAAQEAAQATEEAALSLSLFGSSAKRPRVDAPSAPHKLAIAGSDDEYDDDAGLEETGRENVEDEDLFAIDTGAGDDDQDDKAAQPASDDDEDHASGTDDDTSEPDDYSDGDDDAAYDSEAEVHDDDEDVSSSAGPSSPPQTSRRKPAWTDVSTSSLVVPLVGKDTRAPDGSFAGTKRLKKLRQDQSEREIAGVEYERRLRDMFEKLNPRPTWASVSLRSGSAATSALSEATSSLSVLLSKDSGLVGRGPSAKGKSRSTVSKLPPGTIEVERLRNANEAQGRSPETDAAIEQVEFHPTANSNVLMVAGRDRRVRLFQIDGTTNPLLQTLHIPSLPIKRATFHPSGTSALFSGPRPYLFSYDLQSGKVVRSSPWRGGGSGSAVVDEEAKERDLSQARFQKGEDGKLVAIGGRRGQVHLLAWDGRSGGSGGGSLIGSVRMNSALAGLAWLEERHGSNTGILGGASANEGFGAGANGSKLATLSAEGFVHLWDTRNLSCDVVRHDAGLFGAKGLELGSGAGGSWAAVGSESGVVNMYEGGGLFPSINGSSSSSGGLTKPVEPTKSITNLITTTTTLGFSPDAQILAFASRNKKDALKLLHLPSLSVFSNWPTSGTPLGHVTDVDFSRKGGYMVVGNSRGRVLLYAMRHYLPSSA